MTLLLSNEEIQGVLTMPECIAALEEAYRDLANGMALTRPRSDMIVPADSSGAIYGLKSMDGVVPRFGVGAIRINSDIITWPVREGFMRREKTPAALGKYWVGLVLLFSTRTGEPLAIFPDGYVQRMRVGATSGLGIKYLAREDARTMGLFGSGWQAGSQLLAACAVRRIERIRVYSPNAEHRRAFAREMSHQLGVEVAAVDRPEGVIEADIVHCATNSIDPVFRAEWVRPGMHVGAIRHAELEPQAVPRIQVLYIHHHKGEPDHYIVPSIADRFPEVAEGKGWSEWAGLRWEDLPTLDALIAGHATGRTSPEQVTCFINNIGMGFQFAAVGARLYELAKAQGIGRELPTEWFCQSVHP